MTTSTTEAMRAILIELPTCQLGHITDCGYDTNDGKCGCLTLPGRIENVLTHMIKERSAEVERLKRALAGHLFDGESLSTREAIRSELIKQGFEDAAELDRLRATVYGEVQQARDAAHAKHGDNGIGALPGDSTRWLSILVEEVGEVAHELTYDSAGDLRKELIQVAAVATAWAAALAGDDGGDHRG